MSGPLTTLLSFALLATPALAGAPAAPAPEMGGGVLGFVITAGVIWLIRRGSPGRR